MDTLLALPNGGTEAFALLSILATAHAHIPGKRFALNFEAMKSAGRIAFGRDRFHAAKRMLVDLRLLLPVGRYSVGKRSQHFQLGTILADAGSNNIRMYATVNVGEGV